MDENDWQSVDTESQAEEMLAQIQAEAEKDTQPEPDDTEDE